MIEKKFIQEGVKKAKLEEFLERELRRANYSHIDVTKTPTSTNITIYAEKPGLVIGRGGHRINEIIDAFEQDFNIENPQVDAQEVEEPDLDAEVVAKNIAGWLEKGGHPKRVGNTYAYRVMDAGAVGVQIEISGKLSGSRGRTEKFIDGYVKKCGDTANQFVQRAYQKAVTKPGSLGVKVMIMKDMPEHMKRALEEEGPTAEEIREAAESEETEAEETEAEEPVDEEETDIDYRAVVEGTVAEVKEQVRENDLDPAAVLTAENNHKERKTLVSWLENRIESADTEAEEDAESVEAEEADDEVDYSDVVEGTVAEVKEQVEADNLDPAAALTAEKNHKERKTLIEWLERRVD